MEIEDCKLTDEETAEANELANRGIQLAIRWLEADGDESMVILSHAASYLMALLLVAMDDVTVRGDMQLGRFVTEHDRMMHHVKSVMFYTEFIRAQREPKKVDVQ